ncbi:hypothetical protein J1TS5_10080 [Paenibacillus macerans]|uniref:VirB4 family type IV secretion system protein n=1 Tax=Paenibacillus macerans TaxID=44252 RepID=UPI001B15D408|nr:DUF87 domain-containing protein [Paenibacillus macerans]GIP08838.1 hypothetical protein J1TS5_10080 [Paenibacillus macerans]
MITYTKRLLKRWDKHKRQTVVNALSGRDDKGHMVRVLMIKGYPPMILAGYLDQLDELVQREGASLRKTIRYAPSEVKFNTAMKNKLLRLNKSLGEVSETDPARPAEVAARDTILALRDSTLNGNSKLLDVFTFLTLSAPKQHQLDAAEASLRTWFDNMDGRLDSLYKEQLEAMRQTSPVFDPETPASGFFVKEHYGRVTTDGVAARTYPMTRGSFSDSRGIYFGRRAEDGGFCFINLCDPSDSRAQNLTVFGKTGEGKSYFLKALVVSLLDEGVHVFVFDLDGEWRDLCEAVGGVYIDHTADEGRYFEPLAIMPAIPELDEECVRYNRSRLSLAIANGIRTFSLLGEDLSRAEIFEAGEAIRRVLASAGIDKDRLETWDGPYPGPRPTIHRAFEEIQKAAESGNPDAQSLLDKIKIYFIGIYDGLFRVEEPLTVQRAPLVVYKVGSGQGAGEKDERAKQAQLKMSMAFDVVNANIQALRFEGAYFSAVVVDEGQRQLQNAELRRAVFDWYTAIRKWNGMMILASNTPAIMLDTAEGIGMWENTSVRVFFYMEQSAVRALAKAADVPEEIQERISQNEGSLKFVIEYHKQYDELFMDVPEEESKLYKTRGLKQAAS